MEKWQIDKVNELYRQIDDLTAENMRLKHNMELGYYGKQLDTIEAKVDALISKSLDIDDVKQALVAPVKAKRTRK